MGMLLGLLVVLGLWLWVLVLPGWVVARAIAPEHQGLKRWTLSLFCAWSTVPLALFLVTAVAGVPMDLPFLLLASTLINLGGAVAFRPTPKTLGIGRRDSLVVFAALVVAALVIGFGIRSLDGGDVFSTVHHCLYVIVMYTIGNDPSWSIPMFDAESGQVIHYLVHHPTTHFNGLAPLFFEQRLGNAPILAPHVAMFGTFGWYWATVVTALLTGLLIYQGARVLEASRVAAGIAAVLFTLGINVFCAYFVNENTYAVVLVAFLIWAALQNDRRPAWLMLMGWSVGHLIGVRYTSALFVPAVMLAALWQSEPWPERWRRFGLGALFVVLATIPWLYVNYVMLGDPFTHPKIHPEHEGRVVTNALFGIEFQFRALNWPFTESVVRTPWSPFPTFLWLPLRVAEVFGQLPLAVAIFGWWSLKGRRRALGILLAFAVPHTLVMMWLETLDWEQLTYSAPGLVPLGLALAVGLDRLIRTPTTPPTRPRLFGAVAAIAAVWIGGSYGLRSVHFPADTRMLDRSVWSEPPPATDATGSVRERLTDLALFPMVPEWRTLTMADLGAALGALPAPGVPAVEGRPVYPSGQVSVLAGYSQNGATDYHFSVAPRPLLEPGVKVRTSLGLHQVSLQLAAERVDVDVVRNQGRYQVAVTTVGSGPLQDFTIWLHPWMPAVSEIVLTINDAVPTDLRTLTYGGLLDEDQLRFIVTNYPAEVLDVVTIPYTLAGPIDGPAGKTCGLFLFLSRIDPADIQTLALAGGHDTFWTGERTGTLTVPANLRADHLVLYTDPYCTTHVPQYGDSWGHVLGPFSGGEPIELRLDKRW